MADWDGQLNLLHGIPAMQSIPSRFDHDLLLMMRICSIIQLKLKNLQEKVKTMAQSIHHHN